MDETLDRRLRGIVAAGWRTAVIGTLVYVASWAFYVLLIHSRPDWILRLWAGALDWPTMQRVGPWFFAALKALLFVFLFGLLFVALLRRQLRRLS